jgi:hypothetical protein
MKYTPAQARYLADIPEQTLRYWKPRLSPISHLRGQTPCYTYGDIVALIVIRRLVHEFHVDVGSIRRYAVELFRTCNQFAWPRLSECFLLISPDGLLRGSMTLSPSEVESLSIVVPLRPILEELTKRLSSQDPDQQLELNLPPVGLPAMSQRVRGSI